MVQISLFVRVRKKTTRNIELVLFPKEVVCGFSKTCKSTVNLRNRKITGRSTSVIVILQYEYIFIVSHRGVRLCSSLSRV